MRRGKKWCTLLGLVGGIVVSLLTVRSAGAIYLDDGRTLFLAGTFYNQFRLRTENPGRFNTKVGDWTMLQHRYFVDPQLRADVLSWLHNVPIGTDLIDTLQITDARFFFNPRFEYDGVYDYGPKAFRDLPSQLKKSRRFRIFEVYGDLRLFGLLNIRGGRQNLSWGETDGFRLIDRINPLDAGFGGFLIPLDERRVPLTMLRAVVGLPDLPAWDFTNSALEAFIAPDKSLPRGAPGPTPWGVRGASKKGFPPTLVKNLVALAKQGHPFRGTQLDRPDVNLEDSRVGVRFLTTWHDISFTLAHMSTYPDGGTPSLQLNRKGDPIIKVRFPNIQVTGFTATAPVSTFQVPLLRDLTYTVFRTEVAGFFKEPFFIEKVNFNLGKRLPRRDVIRGVIGIDHTQWIRSLNPANTFFFTTQLFYTNIQGSMKGIKTPLQVHPGRFVDVARDPILQTFAVSTLYSAAYFFNLAQLQPVFSIFYDWQGAASIQPSLTFIRDPFRFRIEYNNIWGRFTSVGLLRDKDNLAFRIDYLL